MMKKSGSSASLPRIGSNISLCSLPRTSSSCSIGRKGSIDDLLNYANFFDDSCFSSENSFPSNNATPSNLLVPNNSLVVDGCDNFNDFPETISPSTKSLKPNEQEKVKTENETCDFDMLQQKILSMPPIKSATPRTCHQNLTIFQETESVEESDSMDDSKSPMVTQIEITGGEDGGPKKISFGAYGEFTIIDGVMYNNRGYEICGHLNQHNRPCQRIGKCPFHSKNKKQNIEKLLKLTEQASSSSAPSSNSSTYLAQQAPIIQPSTLSPQPQQLPSSTCTTQSTNAQSIISTSSTNAPAPQEKKKVQPLKTPYKQGWSKEEHFRFLTGLEIHGKGAWKDIALIVGTRTPTQIQSHAQKYYLRQKQKIKNKRSIHDFTLDDLKKALAQTGASISINGAGLSEDEEFNDDCEESPEPVQKKPRKQKQAEKPRAKTTPVQPQPVQPSLPANVQQFAPSTIQQALDWTKNIAAYLGALQASQQGAQKLETNPNLLPYSVIGSLLMSNPAFLLQQQMSQMMTKSTDLEGQTDFLNIPADTSASQRPTNLQNFNVEPMYFEQTALESNTPADLMNVFEQQTNQRPNSPLFSALSPVKNEKLKRKLSETNLTDYEDLIDLAPPASRRRHT